MAFAATARVEPRTPRGPSRCREDIPVRRRCARRPIACEPYRNPAARTVASIPRPSARNRSGPSGCSHTSMSRRISLRPVRLQSDNRAHPVRSGRRRAQADNRPVPLLKRCRTEDGRRPERIAGTGSSRALPAASIATGACRRRLQSSSACRRPVASSDRERRPAVREAGSVCRHAAPHR